MKEMVDGMPWWIYAALVLFLIVGLFAWWWYRQWYWRNIFALAMLSVLACHTVRIQEVNVFVRNLFGVKVEMQSPSMWLVIGLGVLHLLRLYGDEIVSVLKTRGKSPSIPAIPPSSSDLAVGTIDVRTATERRRFVLSCLPSLHGPKFVGRQRELSFLDAAWQNESVNIVSIVSWAGVGKSSLVSEWVGRLDAGNSAVIAHSFYRQGVKEARASAERFVESCLMELGYKGEMPMAPEQRARCLASLVQKKTILLILDGLEVLQNWGRKTSIGKMLDPGLELLLKSLALYNPGLVVTTSRLPLPLSYSSGGRCQELRLDELRIGDAVRLFEAYGIHGHPKDLRRAARELKGHALSVTLLANLVRSYLGGDIRRRVEVTAGSFDFLDDDNEETRRTARLLGEYARRLQNQPELLILKCFSLFDRSADQSVIALLRQHEIEGLEAIKDLDERQWVRCCDRLREIGLLPQGYSSDAHVYDMHPTIRAFFSGLFRRNSPDTWQRAHGRLYEHFVVTAQKCPKTRQELDPLYRAVTHGCLAGKADEVCDTVYRECIHRGEQYYATRELGAFGEDLVALSSFFAAPWNRPRADLSPANRQFVLHMAGSRLRALGMLEAAEEPLRLSLHMAVQGALWKEAAICGRHCSEVSMLVGDVAGAVRLAADAVKYADESNDTKERIIERSVLAHALHMSGQHDDANHEYGEAERLQRQYEPNHPHLYGLWGYRYCDLLLREGRFKEVSARAEELSTWGQESERLINFGILDQVWGGLMAGRLCAAQGSAPSADTLLEEAIRKLTMVGYQDDLPLGLLPRARLHMQSGRLAQARCDIEVVLELAQSGSMRSYEGEAELLLAAVYERERNRRQFQAHLRRASLLARQTGYRLLAADLEALRKGQLGH